MQLGPRLALLPALWQPWCGEVWSSRPAVRPMYACIVWSLLLEACPSGGAALGT